MKAINITVKGKVQGVYFRAFAMAQAQSLGLNGYVQNLKDGGVRIYAEGEKHAVDTMIRWCHRGPVLAKVREVHLEETEPSGITGFTIRR